MEILLARHGNTFNPNDKVVWAGVSNDLPLVEEGLNQARHFASQLILQKILLSAIYCAPLQRTQTYASVIAQSIDFKGPLFLEPRLNEIDYGPWTGLSDLEIIQKYGEPPLKAWNQKNIWPLSSGWGGSELQIETEAKDFLEALKKQHPPQAKILVVTSHGRLRYFLKLNKIIFHRRIQENSFKVKTGHVCKLRLTLEEPEICFWNKNPNEVQL